MLRWGRRCRHVSEALVVLSMIMNGMWSASRSAWPRLQNEGLNWLPRPLCWLPALLPPTRKAFLVAAAASSAWSCFLFSWLPDYAVCLWITSMLVITVTLRISCHLRGRRHLEFAGIKNCVRFLDCRGSWRNFRRNRWILQTYKPSCRIPSTWQIQWGLHGGKPPSIWSMLSRSLVFRIVWSFSSVVWNPTFL